jgi:hypothetical protein
MRDVEKKTFSEIGGKLGIGRGGAERRYRLAAAELASAMTEWSHGLSVRALGVIYHRLIKSREELMKAVQGTELLKLRNCGVVTFLEICRWLGLGVEPVNVPAQNGELILPLNDERKTPEKASLQELRLGQMQMLKALSEISLPFEAITRRLTQIEGVLKQNEELNRGVRASLNSTNTLLGRLAEGSKAHELARELQSLAHLTEGLSLVDIHNLCLALKASKARQTKPDLGRP